MLSFLQFSVIIIIIPSTYAHISIDRISSMILRLTISQSVIRFYCDLHASAGNSLTVDKKLLSL